MGARLEELDWVETEIGAISLRRRFDPALRVEVYEVKLDDEFLMSSLFTVAEIELARLGLAELPDRDLDVVVGGLGLGYTARAVLADRRVLTLTVVEALDAVIGWHLRGLLPFADELVSDPRTRLTHGDFFASAASGAGFDPDTPGRRFHAILLDIDHSPRHVLHAGNADLYTPAGLRRLAGHLCPGGVFALWSNDPPDADFITSLDQVFASSRAHVVSFANPLQGRDAANTVYVARLG
jgi:spermidine synthase